MPDCMIFPALSCSGGTEDVDVRSHLGLGVCQTSVIEGERDNDNDRWW